MKLNYLDRLVEFTICLIFGHDDLLDFSEKGSLKCKCSRCGRVSRGFVS